LKNFHPEFIRSQASQNVSDLKTSWRGTSLIFAVFVHKLSTGRLARSGSPDKGTARKKQKKKKAARFDERRN